MEQDIMDLTKYVAKEYNLNEGVFANINNDIAVSITDMNLPPLILMAASYARRIVANGLFLQGIFDKSSLVHAMTMFTTMQQITARMMGFNGYTDTVKFQEDAYSIAINFVNTYDQRLSKLVLSRLFVLVDYVIQNDINIEPTQYNKLIIKLMEETV